MAFIRVDIDRQVAVLTISRPQALNALHTELLDELKETAVRLANDDGVRAVVLTGEGKAFVAGADIGEMLHFTRDEALAYAQHGAQAFAAVEGMPQPVIAAVNGYALGGGCELALACDIRVASERARFGQPEVKLGLIPGFGGTQRLPRAVGTCAAMRMILQGEPIDAQEALRIGLVCAVYPQEALLSEAVALARQIAANAPLAVRAAKAAIRHGIDGPLEAGIAQEGLRFAACFDTEDCRKGMGAFVEKRTPAGFEGK